MMHPKIDRPVRAALLLTAACLLTVPLSTAFAASAATKAAAKAGDSAADSAAAAIPAGALPTISLSEVQRGQQGYGLSVFSGTEPERFDVEVIGVMRNVGPDVSYILARLTGKGLEKSGAAGAARPALGHPRRPRAQGPAGQPARQAPAPLRQRRLLGRPVDGVGLRRA